MQLSVSSLASLFPVALSLVSLALAREESPVVSLSDASFESFLKDNNVTLIEFFAPWCGHCKRLEPEYEKAAQELKDKIKLAHVDCTKAEKLCEQQGIQGYPTLKVFNRGKVTDYGGPREAKGIVQYMKRQLKEAIEEVNPAQVPDLVKEEDVVLLRVGSASGKGADNFKAIAQEMRNEYSFATIPSGIYMLKKFDEGLVKFPGDEEDNGELLKWVRTESTPLMAEVGPDNYGKYIEAGLPMAYLFYEKEEMRKEYGPIVEEAVRPYKGKINAVYIDAVRFEKHAEALSLPKKWPALAIRDIESELNYPFTGKLNKKELSKFFEEFSSGKMEPTYRSEEVPTKESGPVKTVVYKNFEKVVMDPKKDVLLELYAPWCGACKRIAPVYEKLAEAYKSVSDKVVIAKMDGTANDLPKSAGIKLTKFPTIVLFKAGEKKEQVEFEDLSDKLQPFVDFIAKHGNNKVTIKVEDEAAPQGEKEEL